MMNAHTGLIAIVIILICAVSYTALGNTTAPNDVYHALSGLALVHHDEIVHAFGIGFSLGRLEPARTLRLVNRLAANQGKPADKEGILLTIAHALEYDLPVTLLIHKTEEGLTRNVPLTIILNGSRGARILGLVQREKALEVVWHLLLKKGIFPATGKGHTGVTLLPLARFDQIVTEITDVLCNYVKSGASPLEGRVIYQKVRTRLENMSKLKHSAILPGDAALVLRRIGADGLSKTCDDLYKILG